MEDVIATGAIEIRGVQDGKPLSGRGSRGPRRARGGGRIARGDRGGRGVIQDLNSMQLDDGEIKAVFIASSRNLNLNPRVGYYLFPGVYNYEI